MHFTHSVKDLHRKHLTQSLNTLLARCLLWPFLLLIQLYRYLISPLLPASCRYAPSCSCYAHEALTTHGVVKGLYLTARRIARCHPWGSSGFDPVPPHSHHPKG